MKTALTKYTEAEHKIHPTTRKALTEYVRRVAEYEKDNLLKIILFGSVARGDATRESDVDVLVLLKEKKRIDERMIAEITFDVKWDLDFDENAYIMSAIFSSKESENSTLMKNINRDGVVLHESVV